MARGPAQARCPLVGVDTERSEVIQETPRSLFFLPLHAARVPYQFSELRVLEPYRVLHASHNSREQDQPPAYDRFDALTSHLHERVQIGCTEHELSCCVNVGCTEHELVQSRPRSGGLVFNAGGLPHCPLHPSLFSNKCPTPFFAQVQVSTQVLAFALPMCFVAALSPRPDSSSLDTFVYLRVISDLFDSPRFGSDVFRGGDVPTRLPREMISLCWDASPPVDVVGRLALSASTSSSINVM